VKVVWTRKMTFVAGFWYRPMSSPNQRGWIRAANPVSWETTRLLAKGLEGTLSHLMGKTTRHSRARRDAIMAFPMSRLPASTKVGIPVSVWPSVGNSHTAFVVETFIDELAQAGGKDPYEFRRALLQSGPATWLF